MSIFLNPDQGLDKPVSGRGSRGSAGSISSPKIGFWTVEQHRRIVLVGMSGFFHSLDGQPRQLLQKVLTTVLHNGARPFYLSFLQKKRRIAMNASQRYTSGMTGYVAGGQIFLRMQHIFWQD